MSQVIANLMAKDTRKKLTRQQCLALQPAKVYDDGRTKQAFKDECNIQKIMARFAVTNTHTHLAKHQGTYSDYSDFDFVEQTRMLTQGREIFDDLPAEVRREFAQSPAAFFAYVNDPANVNELHTKIPGLAQPGDQLISTSPPDADQAAVAAASEPASETQPAEPVDGG